MRSRLFLAPASILLFAVTTAAHSADVDEASARALVFLLEQQHDRGSIGDPATTPLAALAASHAGADLDRPQWQKSIRWSLGRDSEQTHPLAWEVLLFSRLRDQVPPAALRKRVERLIELQHQQWIDIPAARHRNAARPGETPQPRYRFPVEGRYSDYGGWGKAKGQVATVLDTVLAVWALSEAQSAGQAVKDEVFTRALTFLLKHQGEDGAWGDPTAGARGDATAAGAFALALGAKGFGVGADVALPRGGSLRFQLDKAVKWLEATAHAKINPGEGAENVEGYRFWYRQLLGALGRGETEALSRMRRQLIESQSEDGSWRPGAAEARSDLVKTTALALLTLPLFDKGQSVGPVLSGLWERFGERATAGEKRLAVESILRLGEAIREPLILALRDDRRTVREIAIMALHEHTGQDFGFRPEKDHEKNADAFREWTRWWLVVRSRTSDEK